MRFRQHLNPENRVNAIIIVNLDGEKESMSSFMRREFGLMRKDAKNFYNFISKKIRQGDLALDIIVECYHRYSTVYELDNTMRKFNPKYVFDAPSNVMKANLVILESFLENKYKVKFRCCGVETILQGKSIYYRIERNTKLCLACKGKEGTRKKKLPKSNFDKINFASMPTPAQLCGKK